MKKFLVFIMALMTVMTLALVGCDSNGQQSTEQGLDPNAPKSSPFAFQGNVVALEAVIDGYNNDALWQDPNRVEVQFANCEVTIVRRPTAVYLFYKVYDVTPYRFVATGDADEVTKSDSIEFYFDSQLNRANVPSGNCYQVNLGRDGRTRILAGATNSFDKWLALYNFEVREGDFNNGDYDYYYVEAVVPAAQMNMTADNAIGIAFGQVDRVDERNVDLQKYYTWTGIVYKGNFVDPQIPSTYVVLSPVSLISGEPNRLYTYDEYCSLTGKGGKA